MKMEVAVRHDEYPATVREHVVGKLQRLVKYFDRTVSVRAVLDREHASHRVELLASVPGGVVLVVDSRRPSLGAAVDDAVERMARVLRRHKQKVRRVGRRGVLRVHE